MSEDQEKFLFVIRSLLSTDNDIRKQAEETYGLLPQESKIVFLMNIVKDPAKSVEERQMSAVLLRKIFSSDFVEIFNKLSVEDQNKLKFEIINLLQTCDNDNIRRKICDAAAEVARNLIDDGGNNLWPEFLQFLFQCANSDNTVLKESALRLFTSVPEIFGNQESSYLNVIKSMLQQCLLPPNPYAVQSQAVKAIFAFLPDREVAIQKQLSDLLPAIFQVVVASVEQEDESLLKSLIDIVEACPKFLRPQLDPMVAFCIKVFENEQLEDSLRHLGLEIIVSLAETAAPMFRKEAGKYLPVLVPLVLRMMTQVDEDEKWGQTDEVVEDDNESNTVVAETGLDRLACGIGGKTILPIIMNTVPDMLTNPDWKYRHAALMAISSVGEGCHKQMEQILDSVTEGVLRYASDAHPRVRYAACNALGQMSTDFAPVFQNKFHDRVIPALLMLLDDVANPQIQAHAGAALVNFSEDCPKHILLSYLAPIMTKLQEILNSKFKELLAQGTKLVLEQVVTTIASVADTSEEQFTRYYDELMPALKYIITNATPPEYRLLRGKTIECVSLIALAVGTDKFLPDSDAIMRLLLSTHPADGPPPPEDDPQTSYLITAWARICKVLGKHFMQYLPQVIGPVMRAAALKPELALVDNDDMEEVESDGDWQFVSLGEQQNFGIKTAGLEDKAAACEMLVCYARELKEGFAEYSGEVVKTMVPLLKFYFHDGVRTAASNSMPCLLECAQLKGEQYIGEMWTYMCPELVKAIDLEPEVSVKSEMIGALAKCVELLGKGCLTPEWMKETLEVVDKVMVQHFEGEDKRLEVRKDEDYDEQEEEKLEDEVQDEIYKLTKISELIHAFFLTYKTDFFPHFDNIVHHFVRMLNPEQTWSNHQWGLCIFDDLIEFTGPAAVKYEAHFLAPIRAYILDKMPEVRQAACYGAGVLAMHGGESFTPALGEMFPLLVKVIGDADARGPENIFATENAISAVTKLLKYRPAAVPNVDEVIPHWLNWLPIFEDTEECPHVYGLLCDLIETNHPLVVGAQNSNIPRLIAILAEIYAKEALPVAHPVSQRALAILKQIQAGSGEMFQHCFVSLSPEQQVALQVAMTGK